MQWGSGSYPYDFDPDQEHWISLSYGSGSGRGKWYMDSALKGCDPNDGFVAVKRINLIELGKSTLILIFHP